MVAVRCRAEMAAPRGKGQPDPNRTGTDATSAPVWPGPPRSEPGQRKEEEGERPGDGGAKPPVGRAGLSGNGSRGETGVGRHRTGAVAEIGDQGGELLRGGASRV